MTTATMTETITVAPVPMPAPTHRLTWHDAFAMDACTAKGATLRKGIEMALVRYLWAESYRIVRIGDKVWFYVWADESAPEDRFVAPKKHRAAVKLAL